MAHFAEVDDQNIVRSVIVVSNCSIGGCIGEANVPPEMWDPEEHANCGTLEFPDTEANGQAMLAESGFTGNYRQCSYNASFRGAYPGMGWSYDPDLDEFVPPPSPEPAA